MEVENHLLLEEHGLPYGAMHGHAIHLNMLAVLRPTSSQQFTDPRTL